MAQLDIHNITGEPKAGEDYLTFWNRVETELHEEVMAARARYTETGSIIGLNYRSQVADGYAEYIVTRTQPLTLAHVAYGDGYAIPAPHLRGLNKQDIIDFNGGAIRRDALFGRTA